MRLLRSLVLFACSLVPAALPAQHLLAHPIIDKLPGGATRVLNNGPTRWADTNGWKLVYERTVQPAENAPGRLENPGTATLTTDGRLVTLDDKHPAIRLYDINGKFVRDLGRLGEGPGEYKVPFIALSLDSLFIFDPALRRVTVMTLDGKVARIMPSPAGDYFPISFDARGRMAAHASKAVPGGRQGQWVYFSRVGVPVDSLLAPRPFNQKAWKLGSGEDADEWTIPFPFNNVMHLQPDGTAVRGHTDSYMLVITRTGIDTLRMFGRTDAPSVRVPSVARDSAFQQQLIKRPALKTVAKVSDLPLVYPLWQSLQTDGSGNIWVGARTDNADRSRFDVFAPDGTFLGTVAAPFPVSATVGVERDRVTVIDTDEDDLPRIRIYHINRRGL